MSAMAFIVILAFIGGIHVGGWLEREHGAGRSAERWSGVLAGKHSDAPPIVRLRGGLFPVRIPVTITGYSSTVAETDSDAFTAAWGDDVRAIRAKGFVTVAVSRDLEALLPPARHGALGSRQDGAKMDAAAGRALPRPRECAAVRGEARERGGGAMSEQEQCSLEAAEAWKREPDYQREITSLRTALATAGEALRRSDSMLSLLRHRCERSIPWGTLGVPAMHEVDEVIGQSRKALAAAKELFGEERDR